MTDICAARKVLRRKMSGNIPAFAFPVRESYLSHRVILAAGWTGRRHDGHTRRPQSPAQEEVEAYSRLCVPCARIIFESLRNLGGETPFCGIARLESTAAPRESANKGQTPGRNRRWRSAPHPDDASLSENSAVTNDWSDMKTDKAPPAFFFTDMGVKPVIAVFGKKHASAFPKNAPGASVRCSRVEICLKFCRMCLSGPFTTWRSQFPTGAHGPRVLHRTDKKFPQN